MFSFYRIAVPTRSEYPIGDLYYCIQWDTDKMGVLDKNGDIILPIKYSDIKLRDGFVFANTDDEEEVYQVVKKTGGE